MTRPSGVRTEEVDVALEHAIADLGRDEQLAVVLVLDERCGRSVPERRAGERGDRAPRPDDAFGRALRLGETVDVVAVVEVAELEHAVDGAADRRAVATALPRRELEVDGVLAQAGVVPSARRCPARSSASRVALIVDRIDARARVAVRSSAQPLRIGPRQLERVARSDGDRGDRRRRAPRRRSPVTGPAGRPAARRWCLARCRPEGTAAVERHDEMVDRPRAGDVQQAASLGVAHLLVDRLEVVVHPVALAPASVQVSLGHTTPDVEVRRGLVVSPDTIVIGNSQALGGVDRHDADGVVVVLGKNRVGDAALGRLQPRPGR